MLWRWRFAVWLTGCWMLLSSGPSSATHAQEPAAAPPPPLHQEIDRLAAPGLTGLTITIAPDADFLRRASLDLLGVPPTADEAAAFFADAAPDKRARLVDRLLADPRHARHWAEVLDVWLMERRPNSHVPQDDWMAYLLASTRANKSWRQLVREILSADGDDDDPRAAARFALDRGSEPHLLTRDIGRIFLGRDLQCAQCHDHPLVDDYLMADYHGLLAFVSPGHEQKLKAGDKERAYYSERAGSDLEFESVFIQGTKHLTAARLPEQAELEEPEYLPGEEYEVAPAEQVRPQPKFSRRAKLAELATSSDSRAFNENIVNRLWAQMLGRGLVHPVDLHHRDNPPTHPELMRLLADRFVAADYDMRWMLREIAMTQVYQRALDAPSELPGQPAEAAALIARLEAEAAALQLPSDEASRALEAAREQWAAAEQALLPAVKELSAARTRYAEILKKLQEAQQALRTAEGSVAAKQETAQLVAQAATQAQAAAEKVKDDQELAAAAGKFVAKAKQLQGEVEALQKTAAEKQAAIAAPQAELDAQRPVVTAAQEQVRPLRAAFRERQVAFAAARLEKQTAAIALNRTTERLATAKRRAELDAGRDRIAAAEREAVAAQAALVAAQQAVAEQSVMLAQQQTALDAAGQGVAGALAALEKMRAEHAAQAETSGAVAQALAATEAARQKLPDDPAVQSAATQLKTRADELAAALAAHQTQVDAVAAQHAAAMSQRAAAEQTHAAAVAEQQRRQAAAATAEATQASSGAAIETARGAWRATLTALTADWTREAALADLKPLSPEQLCWSIFQCTGVYDRHRQAEQAELDKASPLSPEALQNPAEVAARAAEIEQRTYAKLKGNVAAFVTHYGAGSGQPQTDFFATPDQALFAANGGSIMSWAAPAGGNVAERIVQAPDPQTAARQLYLGVLTREPTEAESADVAAYLASRPGQTPAAAQELVWGLLTSAEFRFSR